MIVVFGSINMDSFVKVERFPQVGETVLSPRYSMYPGGKGANQALAAARCGVKTALVGKVGDDGMGLRVLNNLKRNGVMTSGVAKSEALPTGMAFVACDSKGENNIIVTLGANAEVSNEQVPDEILGQSHMLVLQMEVPRIENMILLKRARENGAKIMLNLAPAFKITEEELACLDYLVVNQIEARQIAQNLGIDPESEAIRLAQALSQLGSLTCIVTMGEGGVVAVDAQGKGWRVQSMNLENVVDTTGAGDCFVGTLAASLYDRKSLPDSLRRAVVASGMSCANEGLQNSFPYIGDVDEGIELVPYPENVELPGKP